MQLLQPIVTYGAHPRLNWPEPARSAHACFLVVPGYVWGIAGLVSYFAVYSLRVDEGCRLVPSKSSRINVIFFSEGYINVICVGSRSTSHIVGSEICRAMFSTQAMRLLCVIWASGTEQSENHLLVNSMFFFLIVTTGQPMD